MFNFLKLLFQPLRFIVIPQTVPEKLASSAEQEWKRIIREPSNEVIDEITEMFDQNGWAAWLRGDSGGCPNGYIRPPDPDWCGQALANHALKLKNPIDSRICYKIFPSTYRLAEKSYWESLDVPFPRVKDRHSLKRGDIVVLKWANSTKDYGDHITVAVSNLNEVGTFDTIEGNATGKFSDGSVGRGLIKQTRNISQVARIYRLTEEHLEE